MGKISKRNRIKKSILKTLKNKTPTQLKKIIVKKILSEKSLTKHNWRIKVKERDSFKCRLCGDTDQNLQVHHLTPVSAGGDESLSNLITLCYGCHHFMHCNPKLIMAQKEGWKKSIIRGMDRARKEGKLVGRPKGKKDSKQRKGRGDSPKN